MPPESDQPCPICGGPMWDNRLDKRNPRQPDFKCMNYKQTGCQGVIWPPRPAKATQWPMASAQRPKVAPVLVPDKLDKNSVVFGQCRHGYGVQAFKMKMPMDKKTTDLIDAWAEFSMTGKFPEAGVEAAGWDYVN